MPHPASMDEKARRDQTNKHLLPRAHRSEPLKRQRGRPRDHID